MSALWLGTVLAAALGSTPGHQIRIKRPVVVVFPMEVARVKVDVKAIRALGQYLADRLAASKSCRVVPRDRLRKALKKKRRPAFRKCDSHECRVLVARRLGAHRVLEARVVRIGVSCIATARLHGVKKGTRSLVVTARGRCTEDGLLDLVEEVVGKIARALSPDLWPYGGRRRAR